MTPALFTQMLIGRPSPNNTSPSSCTDRSEARSSARVLTTEPGASAAIRSTAAAPFFGFRTGMITSAPARASRRAISSPRPSLAPVTSASFPPRLGMSMFAFVRAIRISFRTKVFEFRSHVEPRLAQSCQRERAPFRDQLSTDYQSPFGRGQLDLAVTAVASTDRKAALGGPSRSKVQARFAGEFDCAEAAGEVGAEPDRGVRSRTPAVVRDHQGHVTDLAADCLGAKSVAGFGK